MTAKDVADLLALLEQHWLGGGLEVSVDGGWAVDAVLGKQTRPHDDLDIALPHEQVPRLRALTTRGFREQRRDDSWECNFVLADDVGRRSTCTPTCSMPQAEMSAVWRTAANS